MKKKPLPKLKKPKPRVRRNPYARALDVATKRHAKALMEYQGCETRLYALRLEIPKLDEMRRVLAAYFEKGPSATQEDIAAQASMPLPELGERKPAAPLPQHVQDLVPAHLRGMIKPHPSLLREEPGQARGMAIQANVGGEGEDAFLPPIEGVELLP